jgi:hypothetical protein
MLSAPTASALPRPLVIGSGTCHLQTSHRIIQHGSVARKIINAIAHPKTIAPQQIEKNSFIAVASTEPAREPKTGRLTEIA